MNINPQASQILNQAGINALSTQISNIKECANLNTLGSQYIQALMAHNSAIQQEMQFLLNNIIPLTRLPSADPGSIVSWLGKLVAAYAMPQMKAYINYTMQQIGIAAGITQISTALQNTISKNPGCALGKTAQSLLSQISSIEGQINSNINTGLSTINTIQTSMVNIVGAGLTATFNTSSPSAFQASVNANLSTFQSQISSFISG